MVIRTIETPDVGLQPSDRGPSAAANAGRRISGLYGDAASAMNSVGRSANNAINDVGGVVVKHMEHKEISAGAATAATLLSGLDADWNAKIKDPKFDPNDTTAKEKWTTETLEPKLEKLREAFMTEGGQKFAEATIERYRNHFTQKTSADMATMAGIAVRKNINTMTNELSNMAITDPSSVKTSLDMVERSVNAMVASSPTLSGTEAMRVREEALTNAQTSIVKAAAIGAINANPEAGLKKFSSPEYSKYISGVDLRQMEAHAKTVERARRVDENYALQTQKLIKQEASDARENEYVAKLYSDDPKERAQVSAKRIATDPELSREARQRMIGVVERALEPEAPAKISNVTANDLMSRIRAPEGDPRRITDLGPVYDAYQKGELNKADLKFVREEFTQLRTPEGARLGTQQEEFIKSVKPLIDKSNPLLGKIDQSGPQQVYNFTMTLRRKVEEYRKAGKDPHDLMDPSKPDYMGTPAALAAFQKPLQESLADTARALRGNSGQPAPARNDVMPAIPPASQRQAGSLYETPKGPMKWTGTGWVAP